VKIIIINTNKRLLKNQTKTPQKPLILKKLQKAQKKLCQTPSADGNFQHLSGMIHKFCCLWVSVYSKREGRSYTLTRRDWCFTAWTVAL